MTQSPTRVGITSKLPGQLNCFIFFYWSLTVTVTVKEKLNEILCQNECGGKTKECFTDFPQSLTFGHNWSSFLLLPIAMLIGQCLRDEGVLMWAGASKKGWALGKNWAGLTVTQMEPTIPPICPRIIQSNSIQTHQFVQEYVCTFHVFTLCMVLHLANGFLLTKLTGMTILTGKIIPIGWNILRIKKEMLNMRNGQISSE